jgi:hypothetical protein
MRHYDLWFKINEIVSRHFLIMAVGTQAVLSQTNAEVYFSSFCDEITNCE